MLTLDNLRTILLTAQGLTDPLPNPATKNDVLLAIHQMHLLQIDTISVVNRSPYLVVYSRIGNYNPDWVTDLLAEGALFEYWAHAACFLPIESYPLYRRLQIDKTGTWWSGETDTWLDDNIDAVDAVMTRVREMGSVRSSDFERTDGQPAGWWNWKIEKQILERLYTIGDLMIARRHNFQRIYDLRERVVSTWVDADAPTFDEVKRTFVLNTVKTLGATPAKWIADYFRRHKTESLSIVKQLAQEGALLTYEVEGRSEPFYVHPDNVTMIENVVNGTIKATRTVLLSPFDPVVWDRTRLQEMFNFDYKIEVYTPAHKRRYGYFTMPILHNGHLVGRLDPKAHRAEGRMEIRNIHFEENAEINDELLADLRVAIQDFADWHGTPNVEIVKTVPEGLKI